MNNDLFYFFHSLAHQSVVFDNLIIFLAVYFPLILLFLVSVFLLYNSGIYKAGNLNMEVFKKLVVNFLVIIGPAFIAYLLSTTLKELIHIERSFVQFREVLPLFDPNQEYSFPSTHAAIFSALAVSIFFIHRKAGYYFIIFALLIGLARVIAGVHFPVDILGGFLLGGLTAYLVSIFLAFPLKKA